MSSREFSWVKDESELAAAIERIIEEEEEKIGALSDESERRAATQQLLKRIIRESFMANYAATEEDFERCWPRLRDDLLCENTAILFNQVFGSDDDEDWDEYEDDDDDDILNADRFDFGDDGK